jgi:hypothetical protein
MIFFLHHNIVYSKSPVYNNINDTGAHIKGTCLHQSHLFKGSSRECINIPLKLLHFSYCQERIIVRCICVFQKSLDNLYIYNLSD